MDALARRLAEVRAVRDTAAVRELLTDCWRFAEGHGEAAGLQLANVLLAGAIAYRQRECVLRPAGDGGAGPVLGVAPLPASGEWWGLLEDGAVVPAKDRRSPTALYWCDSPAGWWRNPNPRAVEQRKGGTKAGAGDDGSGLWADDGGDGTKAA